MSAIGDYTKRRREAAERRDFGGELLHVAHRVGGAIDADAYQRRIRLTEAFGRIALVAPLSIWGATRPNTPGWARALALTIGVTSVLGGLSVVQEYRK